MGLDLKYDLENIGNIDKATIAIRPLTIIAGINSSGKTFVTKSLYTILNAVYKNHFSNQLIKYFQLLENSYQRFNEKLHNPAAVDLEFEGAFFELGEKIQVLIGELTICDFERQEELLKNNLDTIVVFENEIKGYFSERIKLKKFEKYKKDIEQILTRSADLMAIIYNRQKVIVDNIAQDLEIGFKKNFQITDLYSLINRDKKKNMKLSLEGIGEIEVNQKSVIDFSFQEQGIQTVQSVENIVFFDSPIYTKIRQALQKNKGNTLNLLLRNEDKYLKGYPEYLDRLYSFMDREYIDTPDFIEISQKIEKITSGRIHMAKSGDINYTDIDNHTIPLSLTAMGISNIGLINLLIDKKFSQLSEAEKVDIVLDDLSKPFYDLYMQDM